MVLLPDYPHTTKWLTEAERIVAQGRLAVDAGSEDAEGEENLTLTLNQISSILSDADLGKSRKRFF